MPIPYIHVACERVILDQQQSGVASLIGLFSKLTVTVPPDSPEIPANAVAPKEWSIFSSWDAEESDDGKEYAIFTRMFYPNGTPFGEAGRADLKFIKHNKAQNIVRLMGFPLGQPGFYTVRIWLEYEGKSVGNPIEFKLELVINRQEKTDEQKIDGAAQGNEKENVPRI